MEPRIADAIVMRPLAGLIPYARNARTHTPEQIAQTMAPIREYGFTNPVLVDEAGGINAGYGRVLAAEQLGLVELPTIELGYLTEEQQKAHRIADNKLALNSGWDEELLSLELNALFSSGYDLSLTGFSERSSSTNCCRCAAAPTAAGSAIWLSALGFRRFRC